MSERWPSEAASAAAGERRAQSHDADRLSTMQTDREKIAMPTCHDTAFAREFDEAGVDVLLVIAIAENGKPIRSRWCQSGFGTTG